MATELKVLNYCLSREITTANKDVSKAANMAGPGAPNDMSAACWVDDGNGNIENQCKAKTIAALNAAITDKNPDLILLQNDLESPDYQAGIANHADYTKVMIEGVAGPNVGSSDAVSTYYKTALVAPANLPSFYRDTVEALVLFTPLERGQEKIMVVNVSLKQAGKYAMDLDALLNANEFLAVPPNPAFPANFQADLSAFMKNANLRIVMGGNFGNLGDELVRDGDMIEFTGALEPTDYDYRKWKETDKDVFNTHAINFAIPNDDAQTWNIVRVPDQRWTAILAYPPDRIHDDQIINDASSGTSRYLPIYAKIEFPAPAGAPAIPVVAPPPVVVPVVAAPPVVAPFVAPPLVVVPPPAVAPAVLQAPVPIIAPIPDQSDLTEQLTAISIAAPTSGIPELVEDRLEEGFQSYGTNAYQDVQEFTETVGTISALPDSIEKVYAIETAITDFLARRMKYVEPLPPNEIRAFVASKVAGIQQTVSLLQTDPDLYQMVDNAMETIQRSARQDRLSSSYITLLTRMGIAEEVAEFFANYYRALREVALRLNQE